MPIPFNSSINLLIRSQSLIDSDARLSKKSIDCCCFSLSREKIIYVNTSRYEASLPVEAHVAFAARKTGFDKVQVQQLTPILPSLFEFIWDRAKLQIYLVCACDSVLVQRRVGLVHAARQLQVDLQIGLLVGILVGLDMGIVNVTMFGRHPLHVAASASINFRVNKSMIATNVRV